MSLKGGIDFLRLADDFKGLDPNDPGAWPLAPRVAVFVALFLATVAAAWWFDWSDQQALLEQRQTEEQQLRQDWLTKKRMAVNLDEHKRQLAEIDREFGALLRQLPSRAEIDSLLADINQAGLGRGLKFDLFKPGAEVVKEFYAEVPIAIQVTGSYHDLGAFASDVARMPRIVTLDDIAVDGDKSGELKLVARATTYRFLDEDELAQQRHAKADEKVRKR